MRKKITRSILFTLLCLSLIAPQQEAHAEDLQISCSDGGSYTLVLPAGVVINGNTCTGALVVDSRARVIGKEAFSFSKVTSVQLPNSVVTIEANAFPYNSFTSISLGDSVESIGFEAFRMSKFSSISLPNSLKVIGDCAFCDTYFSTIKLPDSLVSIGRSAFTRDDNPTPLISIEIPDSVKEIGVYAFSNAKLETVKIGKSLKEIPFSAFSSNRLKSVTIPPNVTFIGASSFRGNPLESILLSDGVSGIDTEAFYGTKLVNLSIPDSVRGIGGKAFANISTLKTITLSENFEQFRNSDNALWVGDVFEGSYGISEINYCGKMIGFLIQPVCTGAKKAVIEAKAKAKAEAEAKAKQEADKAAADLLVRQNAATAKVSGTKKLSSITCVKGKTSKKVTAVSPKCPAGYKKR